LRSITVRLTRDVWLDAVFFGGALARAGRRADFAAVLAFRALVALPALLTVAALLRLAATRAFRAPPAFAAFRVRATAAVFFRAALFLAALRARDFARADPLFLVAAALRLAIALVLSATGLP
jgi:hypothetical protein